MLTISQHLIGVGAVCIIEPYANNCRASSPLQHYDDDDDDEEEDEGEEGEEELEEEEEEEEEEGAEDEVKRVPESVEALSHSSECL